MAIIMLTMATLSEKYFLVNLKTRNSDNKKNANEGNLAPSSFKPIVLSEMAVNQKNKAGLS
jgi:hypothetical protein